MLRLTLAKRTTLLLLCAAVAVCAVYLCGLGVAPLVGSDEPRYAQVAREMFARGDFVTPTLGGHIWFEKPALLYWLMMANYEAFGVSEFAARLGSAVAGVLTIVIVFWLGRRVEKIAGEEMRHLGILSAAVTASCAGLLVFSRAASFDILLTLTLTLTLACFLVAELEEKKSARRLLLAGFYAGVGLSLLAKGLVGVVIPAGVVMLYFLLRRRWPDLIRLGILWGPALSLALAAVWYAPVIERHGWKFINEFFVQQHFARYLSNKYKHPQPFYYYVPIMILLTLPWSAFVVKSLAGVRRWKIRDDGAENRLCVFALAWLVAPIAFFSLSGSKLPAYVLPALPGAALLASMELARYLRRGDGRNYVRVTGALLLTFSLAALIYTTRLSDFAATLDGDVGYLYVMAIISPACVSGVLALFASQRRELCVGSFVCASFLTVLLLIVCALGKVSQGSSVKLLMERAKSEGYGQAPVFQLHTIERTAEFYAAGRLLYDAGGEPVKFEGADQIIEAARKSGGDALVLVPLEYSSQLTDEPQLSAQALGDNGTTALVMVHVEP